MTIVSQISKVQENTREYPFKPGESGNPNGRPKGAKNRFTRLKDGLAEAFEEGGGVQAFREQLKKRPLEVLKLVVQLLPREDTLKHEIAQLIVNKQVTSQASDKIRYVKCDKCNHSIDLRDTKLVTREALPDRKQVEATPHVSRKKGP